MTTSAILMLDLIISPIKHVITNQQCWLIPRQNNAIFMTYNANLHASNL